MSELPGDAAGVDEAIGGDTQEAPTKGVSRRRFIKIGVVTGAGLTLGVTYKVMSGPGMPATDATFAPNAFLRIDSDGSITVGQPVGNSEGARLGCSVPPRICVGSRGLWVSTGFQLSVDVI